MKNIIVALTAIALFCACDRDGKDGAMGPSGPAGAVIVQPTPEPISDVASIVADENVYREGLGQTELSSGLSCTLYTITGGSTILSGANTLTGVTQVATFLLTVPFNQANTSVNDGLNVLPAPLMNNPTYKNLILLKCTGQLVVVTTGYYMFDLASDDGSLLYIDGGLLINNDGGHGVTDVSGTKYLRRGVHTFQLNFSQSGGGSEALILKANGSLVDPGYFYH